MDLYVVVHHPDDPHQPWANYWISGERLGAITTTAEIARFCQAEKQRVKRIFVHRCSYGTRPALIVCSVEVDTVATLPRGAYVSFKNAAVLSSVPPVSPEQGTNFYYA